MPRFLDGPRPRAFAHRGGSEAAPENTPAAFAAAVALGFRYLETDVHLTRDGQVVAFHDGTLDRVTDRSGRIAELTWDEVSSARVEGGYRIPLLVELLDAFPEAYFNIDPKDDLVVTPLADLLQQTAAVHRVCIGSFSGPRLDELANRLGPSLCRAIGPGHIVRLAAASMGLPFRAVVGSCAQVPTHVRGRRLVTRRFIETAHSHELEIHVWTVNGAAEMHHLLDLGADGIMTDRPAVLKDVLQARGQWPH